MSEDIQAPAPEKDPADAIVRRWLLGALILLVVGIALVGAGYLAGKAGPGAREVTGECYGPSRQVSCDIKGEDDLVVGWVSGQGGVDWVDSDGEWHEGGRPECISRKAKTSEVTLGIVEWEHDDVGSWAVLWVDCGEE